MRGRKRIGIDQSIDPAQAGRARRAKASITVAWLPNITAVTHFTISEILA
jgi:hypothetical protein